VGSLARGDFGPLSDIDLVVEGVAAGDFFAAGAALDRLADPVPVDLIPWEALTTEARRLLLREGVVLHEPA